MAERPGEGAGASDPGFGGLLRGYRERGLLSQERLAERSGLSARTIRDLERGVHRPRGVSVRLLADGLGLVGWERDRFEAAAHGSPLVGLLGAQPVGSSPRAEIPCQLPPDVADFVGRGELVRLLREVLTGRPDGTAGGPEAAAVVVSAVAGKAGVGKSALAIHVAHQLAAAFPDGQLYASLRGAGVAGMAPLEPAEILGRFLRAMGVHGGAIPAALEERAALYRSRLAGRRVLVVLDDAADQAQVRPLLPGSPTCAVLVTSRARLAGLAGARLVDVEVLDAGQAVELLARIAGARRVAAEPQAAAAIVAACGALPLAVRIAGARLAARPHWSLGRLAGLLADERGRLDALVHGDLEVRASLWLSYQGLGQQQRCLFRRLGLLDAPDVAAWVAGALLDCPVVEAEALLEDLVEAQLVDIASLGVAGPRYRLHDLVRLFARERARLEEPVQQRREALERALGGWLALAEQADRRLPGSLYGVDHGGALRWALPAPTVATLLADPMAWFEAERVALVAAVAQAAELDQDELAWDLAGSLINFLDLRGYDDDWQHTHQAALAAARRARNRRGQASLLRGLGYLAIRGSDLGAAMDGFARALPVLRQVGDRRGAAYAMEGIGAVHRLQGCYADAAAYLERSMATFVEVGDRHGEAWVRFQIAVLHAEQGELTRAGVGLEEALAVFVELDERRGQAWTQRRLGMVHAAQGDLDRATACLECSLAGLRQLGDRSIEALTLRSLGELHVRRGQPGAARSALRKCLMVARQLDDQRLEAEVLRSLGDLHRLEADHDQAVCHLKDSVEIWRRLDLPLELARTLQSLGQAALDAGSPTAAQSAWREALVLFDQMGTPEAGQVAARLERRRKAPSGA